MENNENMFIEERGGVIIDRTPIDLYGYDTYVWAVVGFDTVSKDEYYGLSIDLYEDITEAHEAVDEAVNRMSELLGISREDWETVKNDPEETPVFEELRYGDNWVRMQYEPIH